MKDALEKAVQVNAEKAAKSETSADEALKYTQAAVNAANAMRATGIGK